MLDHLGRLLAVALFAGVLAGGVATIGHQMHTVPTILAAEGFERAEAPHAHHDHGGQARAEQAGAEQAGAEQAGAEQAHAEHAGAPAAPHAHAEAAWQPEDGAERTLYTLLADLLTGIGYALLLAALLLLRGGAMDWRQGLSWGLAGFAVFQIAPAIGLPPELPGMPVAPVLDRQIWWIATAVLTAAGLALLTFGRRLPLALLGLLLLVLPHLYGAPAAPTEASAVPAWLTQRFIAGTMVVSLLFWATLGLATGWLHGRMHRRPA